MTRLRLMLLLFLIAGLAPVAVLWFTAFRELEREQSAEEQTRRDSAARAISGIEQEYVARCEAIVRKESERDFTEFQAWHAPIAAQYSGPAVTPSQLREGSDPFIKRYFQLAVGDDGVRYQTPHDELEIVLKSSEFYGNDWPKDMNQVDCAIVETLKEDFDLPPAIGVITSLGGDPVLAWKEAPETSEFEADSASKARRLEQSDSPTADSTNGEQEKASSTSGEDTVTPTRGLDATLHNDETKQRGNLRDVINGNQRETNPLKEQQVANEVLAINEHAQEIQQQSMESRGARQSKKDADSPTNSWTNLAKNTVGYDMYGESRVKIYPYRRLALPQSASPMVIFARTIETPVTTYLQGFMLDADAILSYWQKQRAALPNAGDIAEEQLVAFAPSGETLDPRSPDLREQTKKAFPTLPLLVAADVSDISGRYDATRLDYALMAGAYTVLLLVLGFFLLRTVARREALVQQQRDFVAAVSHELRTPLSSIRLQAEMLGGHPQARGIEAVHRVAERIVRDQERLMRLVDTILVSSRIERRSLALTLTQASPEQSLRRAVEQAQRHYPKREVTLEMDTLPALSLDPVVAEQLVYNLIDNALKYSKESGAPVRVAAHAESGRVVVTVADQGCGMQPGEAKRAFEKFYRGKRANEFGAGTGLGLWLCESYARMLGWSIGVESAPGKGCTVTVDIPINL